MIPTETNGHDGTEIPVDVNRIEASPTKRFFIDMLIRDIELIRAIADLVDNSVDGARSERGSGEDADLRGLRVNLGFDRTHFVIEDNCGGISVDTARNYAFRFGRADDMPPTPHSVGQFGVGMKRAIFKLGRGFIVESRTRDSWFVVNEDVEAWKAREEWAFHFQRLSTGEPPLDSPGTRITVTTLNPTVSTTFGLPMFERSLRDEVQAAHQSSMAQGLVITVNGTPLEPRFNELLASAEIRPAYYTECG